MAWYNKYRPSNFDEVIGQELVKTVLINTIKLSKIKHGYLFTGPKGTGKTTLARIFAGQINDLNNNPEASLDIIELDAASNTGVDNIRQLIESAQTPPFAGSHKVFIIDEVHMLSKSAMNAMLKILEEPPSYLVFLLATTNPEKVIPTVLSRLTTLPLSSHTIEDLVTTLTKISDSEGMKIDQQSLQLIAKRANGGQRDGINLLETLSSYELPQYNIDSVVKILGLVNEQTLELLSDSLLNSNKQGLQLSITELSKSSMDGETFLGEYLDFLLEKALDFDADYDDLIAGLSEVLSYRLPITTISSAIALLQVNLRRSGVVGNNSESSDLPKKKSNNAVSEKLKTKSEKSEEEFGVGVGAELVRPLDTEIKKPIEYKAVEAKFMNHEKVEAETKVEILKVLDAEVDSKKEGIFRVAQDDGEVGNSDFDPVDYKNYGILKRVQNDSAYEDDKKLGDPKADFTESKFGQDSLQNFTTKIKELQSSSKIPPILKVATKDLEFVSFGSGNLVLSTGNPFFKPQMEQPKNLQFLIDYFGVNFLNIITKGQTPTTPKPKPNLGTNFGNNVSESVSAKNNLQSIDSIIISNSVVSNDDSFEGDYSEDFGDIHNNNYDQQDKENSDSKPKPTLKVSKKSKASNSTVFYEMYSKLPENTVGGTDSVPITELELHEIIPVKTVTQNSNSEDDWNSAVDSFFDL
jgi:DNA polymerase III subunit gamma/tau